MAAPDPAAPAPGKYDHIFRTEHLMRDIQSRSARGSAITVASQVTKLFLGLGSTMILARLLAPADFGLLAMVSAITGFVVMFRDAGLSMATIQRPQITHAQVSTLFWLNLALSAAVMLVVAALAPGIAWFYKEPRLTLIALALAATFLIGGLTFQHRALLRRQLRFRDLAVIEVVAMIAGIGTSVAMAFAGFGYWSLVGGNAVNSASICLAVWMCSGWRPGLPVRGSGAGEMLRFGGTLTLSHTLTYLIKNADNVILGFVAGPTLLGFYTKAYSLLTLPLRQFVSPIAAATIPALARLQHSPEAFRALFRQQAQVVFFLAMSAVMFSAVSAEEIVRIMLGPGWDRTAAIFLYLAPGAFISATNVAGSWVCTPCGLVHRQLRVSLFAAPIYVLGFLIGSQWGPEGMAASFSITCAVLRIPIFRYYLRDTPILTRDILMLTLKPAAISSVAAGAALLVNLTDLSHGPALALKGLAFAAVLGIATALGWTPVQEAIRLLRPGKSKGPSRPLPPETNPSSPS
jgi:PST family polysaccharide transporter